MIWGKLCLRWCQCLFLVSSLLGGGVHGMTEESLRSALDKAGQFLKGTSVTAEDLKMLGTKLDSLGTEVEGLRTLQTQVKAKEAEIDRLVAMANVKQIESFVTRLSDTMAKEMNLRALGNSASTGGGSEARVLVEGGDFVTMRELKNSFVAGDLLEPSEKILQSWVASLITEELEAFAAGVKVPEIGTSVEAEEKTSTTVCPSALEVVQDVQMALTRYSQDGIGLVDHLQGAQIVHSMTSPTYTPPASETDLLGNVWWRRFIPEDWEDFLPLGWEDWDTRIPSTIQHTLVSFKCKDTLERGCSILSLFSFRIEFEWCKYSSTRDNFATQDHCGFVLANGGKYRPRYYAITLPHSSGNLQCGSRPMANCSREHV